MTMIMAERYHDISCGHRVYGHESKCAHLHGHNYRVTFTCIGALDAIGRVLDFASMKSTLCMFLEDEWDHRFLVWQEDPWAAELEGMDPSVVILPFNPTAENMAQALLEVYGPKLLEKTGVTLIKVKVEETRKCSATAMIGNPPIVPKFIPNGDEPNGLYCVECNEPQFITPGGACCKNGHGGAEGVKFNNKS